MALRESHDPPQKEEGGTDSTRRERVVGAVSRPGSHIMIMAKDGRLGQTKGGEGEKEIRSSIIDRPAEKVAWEGFRGGGRSQGRKEE